MSDNAIPTRLTNQHRSGFTLLELMLVMALLVGLTSIAVPSLSRWQQGQSLDRAISGLRTYFHEARLMSIRHNHDVNVQIDAVRDHASMDSMHDGSLKEPYQLPETVTVMLTGNDSQQRHTQITMTFHPDGTTSSDAFHLRDEFGGVRRIAIKRATGSVEVTEVSQ